MALTLRNSSALLLAVVAAVCAAPVTTATAATVAVRESAGVELPSSASAAVYRASDGENNVVSIGSFRVGRVQWVQFNEMQVPRATYIEANLRAGRRCTERDPRRRPPRRSRRVRTSIFCKPVIGADPYAVVFAGDEDDVVGVLEGENIPLVASGGPGVDMLLGGGGNDGLCAGTFAASSAPFSAVLRPVRCDGDDGDSSDKPLPLDMISGDGGDDRLYGDSDSDSLIGDNDNDALRGGEGSDLLIGGRGDDHLLGGEGDDSLDINPGVPGRPFYVEGNDFLDGESGEDSSGYEWASGPVNISYNGGSGAGGVDVFGGIDRLYGSPFDDVIEGTSGTEDWLSGLGGNDRIEAANDPNIEWGDHVDCGDGSDRAYGDGSPPNTGMVRDGLSGNCEQRTYIGDAP